MPTKQRRAPKSGAAKRSAPDAASSSASRGNAVLMGLVTTAAAAVFFLMRSTDVTPQWSSNTVDVNKRHLPDPLDVLREVYNVSVLHDDPRIIQFENFLTPKECRHIIKLAKPRMDRSTAGLERAFDQSRTSSTGWLTKSSDMRDKIVAAVQERIAQVTNTPAVNQEHFQVLNYEVGQYYRQHHDFIPEMVNYPAGVRLATFFIYLSDVEEGGGTHFVDLDGLIAMPKMGRAILWYNSLYNEKTGRFEQDSRTMHEAMPPLKGVKWAANKWIHVNDFVTPYNKGNSA